MTLSVVDLFIDVGGLHPFFEFVGYPPRRTVGVGCGNNNEDDQSTYEVRLLKNLKKGADRILRTFRL